MIKVGKWIAKHKILIIIIGIALLIPSYLGMAATRINYDVLGSLTVGYQKKVPAGRIKPAFFVSNFWFLSIVFYCNVL